MRDDNCDDEVTVMMAIVMMTMAMLMTVLMKLMLIMMLLTIPPSPTLSPVTELDSERNNDEYLVQVS